MISLRTLFKSLLLVGDDEFKLAIKLESKIFLKDLGSCVFFTSYSTILKFLDFLGVGKRPLKLAGSFTAVGIGISN